MKFQPVPTVSRSECPHIEPHILLPKCLWVKVQRINDFVTIFHPSGMQNTVLMYHSRATAASTSECHSLIELNLTLNNILQPLLSEYWFSWSVKETAYNKSLKWGWSICVTTNLHVDVEWYWQLNPYKSHQFWFHGFGCSGMNCTFIKSGERWAKDSQRRGNVISYRC